MEKIYERAIFALFWEHLKARRLVCAYVKNLAKDGSYYWVFAGAFPIEGGSLSIRLKPSSDFLIAIESVYAKLRTIERAKDVVSAREEVPRALTKLGFEDYDHFMTQALVTEIQSRRDTLAAQNNPEGVDSIAHIHSLQAFVSALRQALNSLLEKSRDSRLTANQGQGILSEMCKRLREMEKGVAHLTTAAH